MAIIVKDIAFISGVLFLILKVYFYLKLLVLHIYLES